MLRPHHDLSTMSDRHDDTRIADAENRISTAGLTVGGNPILPNDAVAIRLNCLDFIFIVPHLVQRALAQRPRNALDPV